MMARHDQSLLQWDSLEALPGKAEPLGATLTRLGVNFAVFSESATRIDLCLYDQENEEVARIALPERSGHVFHGEISGIGAGQRYGLRAYGQMNPRNGQRFDSAKLLVDPYALALDRPFQTDPTFFSGAVRTDSGKAMPKAIVTVPSLLKTGQLKTPWARTILYELHARGFTMRHPGIPEEQRGRFAGLGSDAAIAHFRRLGITAIEVMPLAAWMDEPHLAPLGLRNYWGYNPVSFMAPDPRLVPGCWDEIRDTVDRLHAAGIEIILDVVYNHSGEGDENGPILSFRGLDNTRYYRTRLDDPSRYVDDAGCGNTLRCDDPHVVRLMMDALRVWATHGGFDGFRFDLATTLGRRSNGFDPAAPFFSALLQDPQLRELKLIAEAWDIGPGGYQVGSLDAPFADWNDRYRDTIRRFWKGDEADFGDTATRLSGSADFFAKRRRPSSSINFIVAHDGFTLADLVSFQHKANAANGENNRDGTDANHSWNHGVEGASNDQAIIEKRQKDQRNLLATLLLSFGTPMLLAGSEFGQSQRGNNNAYAQDNEIAWLDWQKADPALADFVAELIALRQSHAVFARDRFLTGGKPPDGRFPDAVWLRPDGMMMLPGDWDQGPKDTIIGLYAAQDHSTKAEATTERLVLCLHRGGEALELVLPKNQPDRQWTMALSTGPVSGQIVSPRSVTVFVET
jgi:glycogen debranching enzyme GlgX